MAQNWKAIKAFYEASQEAILSAGKNDWGIDPYAWETFMFLTPIERAFWNDLREEGCVMYPNFPVGRFFVDFANPCARIAIECDGAKYHTDVERDAARQREIEALGWTVYRLSGRACKQLDEISEEGVIESYSAGRSLLKELCAFKTTDIRIRRYA